MAEQEHASWCSLVSCAFVGRSVYCDCGAMVPIEGGSWVSAMERGQQRARQVLLLRQNRARAIAKAGVLVAEGDSWFDYPGSDVLEELEEYYGYDVHSVAHKGDTIEEMTYDPQQLDKLARKLLKLKQDQVTPKAVLLSAGGNDIAGEELLSVFLNHRNSGLAVLSEGVMAAVIEERLRTAVIELVAGVSHLCLAVLGFHIPILMHGYDYPVPDGRGYRGGFWILPGPWLEPCFRKKGYYDVNQRSAVMMVLIDRYNNVLASVAGGPGLEHLRHVDIRGTLSNDQATYRQWWRDEMHPTEAGFAAVASRFAAVLRGL